MDDDDRISDEAIALAFRKALPPDVATTAHADVVRGIVGDEPAAAVSEARAATPHEPDAAEHASLEPSARIEALLERLADERDAVRRSRIFVRIAITFRDELDDRGQAIDALLEAWSAEPTNEDILDHLEPLVRAEDRWLEVLDRTRVLASAQLPRAQALATSEAMVRWLTREVPDPALARQWVERIRLLDSSHPLVHVVQAATSREHGDLKREISELDLAVLSTRRPDDRYALHLLLASRYLDARSHGDARKQYEQASRLYPDAIEPLAGLEWIANAAGDHAELARVLRRRLAIAGVDEQRVEIARRLATIEEREFRRPELAARTLERAIDASQTMPGATGLESLFDDLERCYRAARMWPELAALLERAAIGEGSAEARSARLVRLGEVLESKLGDVRAALSTYERLAGLLPDDETVVSELARLAEKVSDVRLAVECRERLAELTRDPAVSARNSVIAGQLMMPIDAASARRYFERAVLADPSNAAAWSALIWEARAEGDPARVVRHLEGRARGADMPRVRAAHFVELAEALAKVGDPAAELAAYAEAIASDPKNERAASALLEPLLVEGRYAEAQPLAAVVLAAAERDRDVHRIFAARRAQTQISFAFGNGADALRAALAAFAVRPEDIDARTDVVRAASALRSDREVLSARDALVAIANGAFDLVPDTRVALAATLAEIGEGDRGEAIYEDLLAEDTHHAGALLGLATHQAASGKETASLLSRQRLAFTKADPEVRFAELVEVADALGRIDEAELAADVYESARRIVPTDLSVLHKLLAIHQRLARWVPLFDVLRSISEVDSDPHRRAKTLFTMGQLAHRELLDRGTALDLFDRTLDVDPSQLEAFERIVRILVEAREWTGLARMYRRMIARAEERGDVALSALLGKQLVVVERDRLGDASAATEVARGIVRRAPDDEEAQAMLRELLAKTGQTSDAVEITLERVLRDPLDPRLYPALFDLLVTENARDRALCVASAMSFLDVEHLAAVGWRQSYPQPPVSAIVLDLGPAGYRRLLHPELDPTLTEIFEIVGPAVADIAVSRLSLRERLGYPGPALQESEWLVSSVASAARVLGAPVPRLFARKTAGPALSPVPTTPAGFLVHPPALAGVTHEVLSFLVGKRVLEVSPPFFARALCPSISELKALASSAARIATGQTEPGDLPLAQRLGRDDVARIAAAVQRSMNEGGRLDVLRWNQLADLSVSYAGLLVAGDLEVARAAIAIEPQAPGDLSPRDKMRELVAWFLGDTCSDLRRRLGVALT